MVKNSVWLGGQRTWRENDPARHRSFGGADVAAAGAVNWDRIQGEPTGNELKKPQGDREQVVGPIQ